MKQNKETLKKHFETGDKPTQQQYADLIDSYVDSKQPEGEANRRFVIDETGEVSVASEKKEPVYSLSDIVANKLSLLKDGEVVKEIDLTSYVDDTNLSRLVSGRVDENGLAIFTRDDNSTFTLDLNSLKGAAIQYEAGINISIDNANPNRPIINSELKEDIRYEAYFGNDGSKNSTKTISIIPKNSIFSNYNLAVKNEPVILFPRVNYGQVEIILDVIIHTQNNSPINIITKFRVSGNADNNTLTTNFLKSTMLSNTIKDLTVNVGKFTIEGRTHLAVNYVSNEKSIDDFNSKVKIIVNKVILTPLSNSVVDNFGNELYNNISYAPLVKGTFSVQKTIKGDELLPNSKELNTDLSYNANTRTIVSSTGEDAILPIANAENAGLIKANFYEEGVFTPVVSGYTFSNSYSRYVRIGNLVKLDITLSGVNGLISSAFKISSLPFSTLVNASGSIGAFSNSSLTLEELEKLICCQSVGAGGLIFAYLDRDIQIQNISFTNGTIRVSVSYITNVYTP
ncbi:hypothetical protein CXF68_04515 [Tenacibaculum sp. Bg11-29]|uniref:hypothetical protein n=1 Tax=Tenacibaculum sp. Bg11-29 TaxID=2058306 RepID=UPI000C3456EF|nr:hypothetical protein [Tenacibaculum sp. Bg11-29]PKH50011.1 hypothetical protein CXF68_04515 [Tenacibaculum sp. Bg11-29]